MANAGSSSIGQFQRSFCYQDVLDVVCDGVTMIGATATEVQRNTNRDQRKKDSKALFVIHQCVDANVFEKIVEYETAKEAWDALATAYSGDKQTKKVKLQSLRRQYDLLQMDSYETVANFVNRLVVITNQMRNCGETATDLMKVEKVLRCLTPNFDHVVTAIEQSKDLTNLKLEVLLGSLEAREMKVKEREGVKE